MSLQPFHNFTTIKQSLVNDQEKHVAIVRHIQWLDSLVLTFVVENSYSSQCVKIYKNSSIAQSNINKSDLIGHVNLITDEDFGADSKPCIGWLEVAPFSSSGLIYLMTIIKKIKGDTVEYVERIFKLGNVNDSSFVLEQVFQSSELTLRTNCSVIADLERECIYMIGGLHIKSEDTDYYSDKISQFNLKTNEWSLLTRVHTVALYSHSSLLWKNKYIVIFGGYYSSCSVSSNIILYNLETNEWFLAYNLLEDSPSLSKTPGRTNSGIALVPNAWASKFNRNIPNNSECDTLLIYGGRISKIVSKRQVYVESSDILLFHLKESKFKLRNQREEYNVNYPYQLNHYVLAMPKNESSSVFVFGEEISKMSLILCGFDNISKADLFSSNNSKSN